MNDTDRKEFFALIADVNAFYKKDFSKFVGNVWWEALKTFDFGAVKDALNRHCVNPDVGQFAPMPADVVRMLQGSTQDSALVAWAKVDRGLRVVGTWRSVVFDDPLIHRVLNEMGGWVPLGQKTDDDWPFVKNEFVTRYRGYRGRSEAPEYPPVLIGSFEAANGTSGFRTEPPMLIGDAKKAEKVMQLGVNKPMVAIAQAGEMLTHQALRLGGDGQKVAA